MDSVGEGKCWMIWENITETFTLPYVKKMASTSSMHGAGHPNPVLWDNTESREGGGKGIQDEADTYISVAISCLCMAKTITIL